MHIELVEHRPTGYAAVFVFWVILIWFDLHNEQQKRPDHLCSTVSGLLIFIFFPFPSLRPEYFKIKTAQSDELIQPIYHLDFYWGSHVNKTDTRGSNFCGAVSSSSLNGLHC